MKPGTFNVTGDRSLTEFGKLVCQCSRDPATRPSTLTEFVQQLEYQNITFEISPDIKEIRLHDREPGVFSILLPSTQVLGDGATPSRWESYPIPSGYAKLDIDASTDPAAVLSFNSSEWESFEDFDNFRIGDYCSSQCA